MNTADVNRNVGVVIDLLKDYKKVDAMHIALQAAKRFDVKLDWHEWSDVLEWMKYARILEFTGLNSEGMSQYEYSEEVIDGTKGGK